MAAEHIFGPEVGSLKGKTTQQASPIIRENRVPVPPTIIQ
jgi:hypothetical protein